MKRRASRVSQTVSHSPQYFTRKLPPSSLNSLSDLLVHPCSRWQTPLRLTCGRYGVQAIYSMAVSAFTKYTEQSLLTFELPLHNHRPSSWPTSNKHSLFLLRLRLQDIPKTLLNKGASNGAWLGTCKYRCVSELIKQEQKKPHSSLPMLDLCMPLSRS